MNTTGSTTPVPSSELVDTTSLYYSTFPSGQQDPIFSKMSAFPRALHELQHLQSIRSQVRSKIKVEDLAPGINLVELLMKTLVSGMTGKNVGNTHGHMKFQQFRNSTLSG